MVDFRFPTHWLNDRRLRRATAEQFQFYVWANAWAVANMTDGRVDRDDLHLIPGSAQARPAEMVGLGLWEDTDTGWFIVDFPKTQSSASQVEAALANRREADRQRQEKRRERERLEREGKANDEVADEQSLSRDGHVTSGNIPPEPDPSRSQSRDGHVTSQGKARQGKANSLEEKEVLDSDFPTDETGIKYRQWIDRNGIKSPAELAEARTLDPAKAKEIWGLAFPGRRAA